MGDQEKPLSVDELFWLKRENVTAVVTASMEDHRCLGVFAHKGDPLFLDLDTVSAIPVQKYRSALRASATESGINLVSDKSEPHCVMRAEIRAFVAPITLKWTVKR